jgi:tellurite resistance protein
MNEVVRKKLNLLVHLANLDGKFDQTERDVLSSMLKEAGTAIDQFSENGKPILLSDYDNGVDKIDVLYWAIRLIKADGKIHPDELAFCKALALKLGFNLSVLDVLVSEPILSKAEFEEKISQLT